MTLVVALLAAVVVLGGAAAAVALILRRTRSSLTASNEVIPGHPTRAPASWAGSHDVAARLHRRLRDAMTALRANQAFDDDGGLLDLRVELEQQTLRLDDGLVAIAALPEPLRSGHLVGATEAVSSVEATVAQLAGRVAQEAAPALRDALGRVQERTALIDQIRRELDGLPAMPASGAPGATGSSTPGLDGPTGAAGATGTTQPGPG